MNRIAQAPARLISQVGPEPIELRSIIQILHPCLRGPYAILWWAVQQPRRTARASPAFGGFRLGQTTR